LLIEQLTLTNILSFGPEPETVTFGPLTVLIGANGSGKSNLLEVIDLLRNAPVDLLKPIREGGGIEEWRWKGQGGVPSIGVITDPFIMYDPKLQYTVSFGGNYLGSRITREQIARVAPLGGQDHAPIHYQLEGDKARLNDHGVLRDVDMKKFDLTRSILAQRRDPERYPEITDLAEWFGRIHLYREWSFGRDAAPRQLQLAGMPDRWLNSDARNLGVVIKRLSNCPGARGHFLEALRECYDGITNFGVDEIGDFVQAFVQEGPFKIPATRLSDGTLRYLCLLAILCQPNPPPLVCIEEPELGLHPDILLIVARLLREASERCQLIVTTHSEVLVDAMTDTPDAVIVCEKHNGVTKLQRLSPEELEPWLEKYRLGELWTSGQIGGNRW
jgi:predicted ATPase